ncbi:MAG TPA: tripartite tricarboxylate transporter substrate binding protein [Burkholderiales bacterium]|nr:tripartite tricarboxylate transporter substrate binding protein [Burkholderiales bacterium]
MRPVNLVDPVYLFLLLALALPAQAQNYPDRPIRLIVPLAAGGAMDTIARSVGAKLTDNLGQTVVVDNRGGGGGTVGAGIAMSADADGYTLIMLSATSVIRPLLYKANYVMFRDFTAISQVSAQPYLLVVNPKLPVKTVPELVTHAKANPGKLNYASAGQGSIIHLASELLGVNTGIRMVHVPYKGMGAAYPDLLAGHTQLALASVVSALPHTRSGRLRGVAVTSPQRSKAAPDIPTIAESGVKGYAVTNWYGLLAPAKTPRPIIDRLHRNVVMVLQQPDVAKRFSADGAEAVHSTPVEFTAHIKAETRKWAGVIKQAGIKGD